MRCSAYSVANDFDIKSLYAFYSSKYKSSIHVSALHIEISHDVDIFVIYGAIIFWNFNEQDEISFINEIVKFAKTPIEKIDCDVLDFQYGDTNEIKLDKIVINHDDQLLSKIAISYGLAQSSMLSYFEDRVDRAIYKYEDIVSKLATHGIIPMSRKDVCRKMGSLFLVRNQINIQSDILDTPTFVWNYPKYEDLYEQTIYEMNLVSRTSVLNKRLDIMQDLFDILNNQVLSIQSARLEWIIIVLIFIEIVVSLVLH